MGQQLFQSLGQFLSVYVTGMLVYKDWSAVQQVGILNASWQPALQGVIAALAIWGISRIPVGRTTAGLLIGALLLSGCTTTGQPATNIGSRILADLGCVTALAGAGLAVSAASKDVKDVSAEAVLAKITEVGESNVPVATLSACAQTIDNAAQSAAGLKARIKARQSAPAPPKP